MLKPDNASEHKLIVEYLNFRVSRHKAPLFQELLLLFDKAFAGNRKENVDNEEISNN